MTSADEELDRDQDQRIERVRPLNATQTNNMLKIITGDYEVLRAEVVQFASEEKTRREEQAKLDINAEKMERLLAEATALVRDFNDQARLLSNLARGEDISLVFPTVLESGIKIDDSRLKAQLNKIANDIRAEQSAAITQINKQELAAKRQILRASITGEAEEILNGIPSAAEMFALVAQEKAARELAAREETE
jgi:hypothetical protein